MKNLTTAEKISLLITALLLVASALTAGYCFKRDCMENSHSYTLQEVVSPEQEPDPYWAECDWAAGGCDMDIIDSPELLSAADSIHYLKFHKATNEANEIMYTNYFKK